MAKPPPSPPSSDLKKVGRDDAASRRPRAAEGEEHARRESKGRPANTKR